MAETLLDRLVNKATAKQGATVDEEKPIIGGSNLFLKIIDTINTPQHMLFGTIKAGLEGTIKPPEGPMSFGDAARNALGFTPEIRQAAVTGAREDTTGGDLLGALGAQETLPLPIPGVGTLPLSRDVAGLPLDIFADLPILGTAGKTMKLGREALEASNIGIKMLGTPEVRAVKQIISDAASKYASAKSALFGKAEKFYGEIGETSRKHKVHYTEVEERIIREAEVKKAAAVLRNPDTVEDFQSIVASKVSVPQSQELPEIVEMASNMRRNFDDILLREKASLMGTVGLDDTSVHYVTHLLSKEAKEKIVKFDPEMRKLGPKFNPKHAFQFARKYRGDPIPELNTLARAGKLPGYEGVIFNKFFEDDPVKLLTVRMLRGEKAIADAEVFLNAASDRRLGKMISDPDVMNILKEDPMRYVQLRIASDPDPRVAPLAKFMQQFVFDPDVAKHLDAYSDAVLNPRAPTYLEGFFHQYYDSVQNAWKKMTLFMWPAYHARNVVGNLFNNVLAGIYDPSWYAKAAEFTRGAPDKIYTFGNVTKTKSDWLRMIEDFGLTKQFSAYIDIGTNLKTLKPLLTAAHRLNPIRGGMAFGNMLEDNARMAHFFAKLNEGKAPYEAALSVKKYLFDYNDLTGFEKTYLRRAFPFYAWTRNNVPLQIRSLIDQPQKYSALGDFMELARVNDPVSTNVEDVLVSDWIKENTGVQVRKDEKGNPEYFLLGGWLPAADLAALEKPLNEISQNLSPLLKVPLEQAFNWVQFLNKNVEDPIMGYFGEKERFSGMVIPKRVTHVLRTLRPLVELDRYMAATQKAGLTPELTDRRGEDLSVAVIRGLFGPKIYNQDLAAARRSALHRKRELLEKARSEARYGRTYNVETIREQLKEKIP